MRNSRPIDWGTRVLGGKWHSSRRTLQGGISRAHDALSDVVETVDDVNYIGHVCRMNVIGRFVFYLRGPEKLPNVVQTVQLMIHGDPIDSPGAIRARNVDQTVALQTRDQCLRCNRPCICWTRCVPESELPTLHHCSEPCTSAPHQTRPLFEQLHNS